MNCVQYDLLKNTSSGREHFQKFPFQLGRKFSRSQLTSANNTITLRTMTRTARTHAEHFIFFRWYSFAATSSSPACLVLAAKSETLFSKVSRCSPCWLTRTPRSPNIAFISLIPFIISWIPCSLSCMSIFCVSRYSWLTISSIGGATSGSV